MVFVNLELTRLTTSVQKLDLTSFKPRSVHLLLAINPKTVRMNARKKRAPTFRMSTGKKKRFVPLKISDGLLKSLGPISLFTYGGLYLRGLTSEILSFYPSDFMKKYLPRDAEPGFYTEIGRKSRDLLFEGYNVCSRVSLDKYPFSASLTHAQPNDIILGKLNYHWVYNSASTDVTLGSNSSLALKSSINQLAWGLMPGLSCLSLFDSAVPNSGKIEIQFLHDFASFKGSIGGLFHDANISLSPVIGTKFLSLGMDVQLQTNTQTLTKCNAAFAYTSPEKRTCSIALNELGHVLMASYHQCHDSSTSIGAQFSYHFIDQRSVLSLGMEHKFDGFTSLKAKADSTGLLNFIFKWSVFSVVGEWRRFMQLPRIGLQIALSF